MDVTLFWQQAQPFACADYAVTGWFGADLGEKFLDQDTKRPTSPDAVVIVATLRRIRCGGVVKDALTLRKCPEA